MGWRDGGGHFRDVLAWDDFRRSLWIVWVLEMLIGTGQMEKWALKKVLDLVTEQLELVERGWGRTLRGSFTTIRNEKQRTIKVKIVK